MSAGFRQHDFPQLDGQVRCSSGYTYRPKPAQRPVERRAPVVRRLVDEGSLADRVLHEISVALDHGEAIVRAGDLIDRIGAAWREIEGAMATLTNACILKRDGDVIIGTTRAGELRAVVIDYARI